MVNVVLVGEMGFVDCGISEKSDNYVLGLVCIAGVVWKREKTKSWGRSRGQGPSLYYLGRQDAKSHRPNVNAPPHVNLDLGRHFLAGATPATGQRPASCDARQARSAADPALGARRHVLWGGPASICACGLLNELGKFPHNPLPGASCGSPPQSPSGEACEVRACETTRARGSAHR